MPGSFVYRTLIFDIVYVSLFYVCVLYFVYSIFYSFRLIYKWTVKNGGYLRYINRETKVTHRVSLKGQTRSVSYVVQWDLLKPYHSCIVPSRSCFNPPIETTDLTERVLICVYDCYF